MVQPKKAQFVAVVDANKRQVKIKIEPLNRNKWNKCCLKHQKVE
jgi:hypothetical protein